MKIAVIGGGWAGMAASHVLTQAGHQVTVFELSHQLGGRARGVDDAQLGGLDNGQHLLIGAYRQTLALIQEAHGQDAFSKTSQHHAFWRLPLHLISVDRQIQIRVPHIYASRAARLLGLSRAQGFSRLERWRIISLLGRLTLGFSMPSREQTVLDWLKQQHQNERSLHLLWIPLCLATMNTAPEMAAAALFARILQDSLLSPQAGATDLIIPRCDLTTLWITALAQKAQVQLGAHIEHVTPAFNSHHANTTDQVLVQNQRFDGCIVATPPAVTAKLVRDWPGAKARELQTMLEQFEYLPITTCYMELDRPLALPYPMMMLSSGHGNTAKSLGQWVFDRNVIQQDASNTGATHKVTAVAKLAFVISHAGQGSVDRQTLAADLIQQLWEELSRADPAKTALQTMPNVVHNRIITEKRATFAATPGLVRPSIHSPWANIKLAGDWTDTGYPAVLEGAVISGTTAAQALLQALQPNR